MYLHLVDFMGKWMKIEQEGNLLCVQYCGIIIVCGGPMFMDFMGHPHP
jgi:hypothetical protein